MSVCAGYGTCRLGYYMCMYGLCVPLRCGCSVIRVSS